MFTIRANPAGCSRRQFLHVGALGLGGLGLPELVQGGAARERDYVKDKAVVFVWLGGGPPQHETFDPKPDAPDTIRTMFGAIQTATPGVLFGSHFPRLAQRMNRIIVVRSFQTPCHDHQENWVRQMLTGSSQRGAPSVGSLYAYLRGANHPRTGMPTYVMLDSGQNNEFLQEHFIRGNTSGDLPQAYTPFNPVGAAGLPSATNRPDPFRGEEVFSPIFDNMQLRVPLDRMENRRSLQRSLDALSRRLESFPAHGNVEMFREQAFNVLRGSVAQAFQLDREHNRTLARYDTSDILVRCPNFVNLPDYPLRPSLLGRQMLLARRLCEAGAGFVFVENCGWDLHANKLNPDMTAMHGYGPQLDRAVSAFLDDVHERGLSDKILLVVTGEMGRTPRINDNGGRDHWHFLSPLLLAGGGLNVGQVIGRSDAQAGRPATAPITTANLASTILRTVFDVGLLRVHPGLRNDLVRRVDEGEPIRGAM